MSVDSGVADQGKAAQQIAPNEVSQCLSESIIGNEKGQKTSSNRTEPAKPRNLSPVAWVSVVISLLCSMFLFSLDNVIVADIQPSIIKTLGHVDELPWISVGYALGGTAVNLFVFVTPSKTYESGLTAV